MKVVTVPLTGATRAHKHGGCLVQGESQKNWASCVLQGSPVGR